MLLLLLLLLRIQPDTPINEPSAASTEYAENFHVDNSNNNNNMYFRTAAYGSRRRCCGSQITTVTDS